MIILNLFDNLVLHACRHRWCWNLYCTTCGNMQFRNGMELIGAGIDPLDDSEELTNMGLMWHDDANQIAARSLRLGSQVAAANIASYREGFNGRDWLGFMGLALWRFKNFQPLGLEPPYRNRLHAENRTLILSLISNSWSEQFYSLFVHHPVMQVEGISLCAVEDAIKCCKKIMTGERPQFQIEDLSIMEAAVIELNKHERTRTSTTKLSNATTP